MTRISSKLTYANVMATIAVFIALGGGAFAALRVPKNSVGNKQLRRNSVTGSKVRDASLTGKDIRVRSLTGANLSQIGLANLLGGSGTATNDGTVSQAAGTCGRYVFSASNAQPGDAVMLGGSDIAALAAHAMIGAPTVSTPNKLNITVCGLGTTVDQAPATIQLRFDTLR